MSMFCFFFFSSRRRHTRFDCDWSSDVCSSDLLDGGHCVATIHAEANAILQAAKNGVMIEGAELYTTASPCWGCFKLIANAGIRKIFYGEFYRDQKSLEVARRLGINLIDLAPAGPAGAAKTGAGPAERSGGTGRTRGGCGWQGSGGLGRNRGTN